MTKNNILVSVLIINYNNASLIKRAIRSCLMQTYKNIEILVYDDKSTDNSKNNIPKNNKIRFFQNKKIKLKVAAFNAFNGYKFLIKKSNGKILCLLDSDDYFHKSKIKKIVNFFKKNKNTKFLQNYTALSNCKKKNKQNIKNNYFSAWPYFAPESCLSFKKSLVMQFFNINRPHEISYPFVWFGFRLCAYSFFVEKKFSTIREPLTFYKSIGESKKYTFLGKKWWNRRSQSHSYLKNFSNSSRFSFDYMITNCINFFLK